MTDARALLAAERQSRRISHPHLTYSKSGALTCNVCNLNVRSEQLWPGHVKSANHRKNVLKAQEQPVLSSKRKIEEVDHSEGDEPELRDFEVDSRKKPKAFQSHEAAAQVVPDGPLAEGGSNDPPAETVSEQQIEAGPMSGLQATDPPLQLRTQVSDAIDEEEWAAFERDVAPLTQETYASATIEAAPVPATALAEQQRTNAVQQREDEADAEKEEESRRMEEEFEVMEEMEDRVKRLRARREALRPQDHTLHPIQEEVTTNSEQGHEQSIPKAVEVMSDHSDDDDEVDDWYI